MSSAQPPTPPWPLWRLQQGQKSMGETGAGVALLIQSSRSSRRRYIPRLSRCAFFLPLAEIAICCVVCSKKSLFLSKVLLHNLARTWSANVALWSGNVAFWVGQCRLLVFILVSPNSKIRKMHSGTKMRCLHQKEPLAQTAQTNALLGGPRYVYTYIRINMHCILLPEGDWRFDRSCHYGIA